MARYRITVTAPTTRGLEDRPWVREFELPDKHDYDDVLARVGQVFGGLRPPHVRLWRVEVEQMNS